MFNTVGELKTSVAGLLQGTNLNRVTNVDGAIQRAARTMLQQADVPEASGVQSLILYGGVDFYAIDPLIFGGAINLILPQGQAASWLDGNIKVQLDTFSGAKNRLGNGYMVTVQYDKGQPLLGVSSPNVLPQVILSPMNDVTYWTNSGTAGTITADYANYYQQPASLRFDVTTGVGTLTSTITPTDLSSYQGVGVGFIAINTPSGADLSAMSMVVGSSVGNVATVTATEGFLGAWTSGEWTIVAFDFSTAVNTGTPNWAAITTLQVNMTAGATLTNIRLGGMWMSQPCPHNLYYQTAGIFKNAVTGVISNVISSDSDYIILSDPAYTLLEHESAYTIAFQNGGSSSGDEIGYLKDRLYGDDGLYNKYRADNPSSELRTIESYYDMGDGYGRSTNW